MAHNPDDATIHIRFTRGELQAFWLNMPDREWSPAAQPVLDKIALAKDDLAREAEATQPRRRKRGMGM